MLKTPGLAPGESPLRSAQKTGSPSKRGKQHHATEPCASMSAPMLPLPIKPKDSDVTFLESGSGVGQLASTIPKQGAGSKPAHRLEFSCASTTDAKPQGCDIIPC